MSFKYAKELYLIAKELKAIENESCETKVASVKVAGWFSKLFATGMNEENKEKCQEVVQLLNGQQTLALLMLGKVNDLDHLMQPLKKTKQLNTVYDKFMKFFKDVYNSFPKSVLNKAKDMKQNELIEQIKSDKTLQDVVKQFDRAMDILKQDLKTVKTSAGFATDSWEDAFNGWKGIDFGD